MALVKEEEGAASLSPKKEEKKKRQRRSSRCKCPSLPHSYTLSLGTPPCLPVWNLGPFVMLLRLLSSPEAVDVVMKALKAQGYKSLHQERGGGDDNYSEGWEREDSIGCWGAGSARLLDDHRARPGIGE